MKQQIYHTNSAEESRRLGAEFARRLRAGDLVVLRGELGAGKTTFVQGVASGLGVREEATSPTFVLIIEHEGTLPVLHLDAYRLENYCFDAIRDAGVPDFLDREDAVKLVEWPERIADFLPRPRFEIELRAGDSPEARVITITEAGAEEIGS
jgi:tRNA threonylcarbamoyladenosine biosynthesis protein TsaE